MSRSIVGALGAAALPAVLLVGGLAAAPQADAHATYHPWGTTSADTQQLRKGCRYYKWHFTITAPTEEWSAEIFLVNPRGVHVASAAIDSASENDSGTKKWQLCYYSTVPGRYTMKMKVTYNVNRDVHDGYVKPSHFRIKPRPQDRRH